MKGNPQESTRPGIGLVADLGPGAILYPGLKPDVGERSIA